jgi:hypothetical protein
VLRFSAIADLGRLAKRTFSHRLMQVRVHCRCLKALGGVLSVTKGCNIEANFISRDGKLLFE